MLMVTCGYFAEKRRGSMTSKILVSLSFVLLLVAFIAVYYENDNLIDDEKSWTLLIIFLLWLSYGFAYFLRNQDRRNTAYNILDLLSKVGFGFFLYIYIREV